MMEKWIDHIETSGYPLMLRKLGLGLLPNKKKKQNICTLDKEKHLKENNTVISSDTQYKLLSGCTLANTCLFRHAAVLSGVVLVST